MATLYEYTQRARDAVALRLARRFPDMADLVHWARHHQALGDRFRDGRPVHVVACPRCDGEGVVDEPYTLRDPCECVDLPDTVVDELFTHGRGVFDHALENVDPAEPRAWWPRSLSGDPIPGDWGDFTERAQAAVDEVAAEHLCQLPDPLVAAHRYLDKSGDQAWTCDQCGFVWVWPGTDRWAQPAPMWRPGGDGDAPSDWVFRVMDALRERVAATTVAEVHEQLRAEDEAAPTGDGHVCYIPTVAEPVDGTVHTEPGGDPVLKWRCSDCGTLWVRPLVTTDPVRSWRRARGGIGPWVARVHLVGRQRALHGERDAMVWAEVFADTFPRCGVDVGTLVGWFANAIETGRDLGASAAHARAEADAYPGVTP